MNPLDPAAIMAGLLGQRNPLSGPYAAAEQARIDAARPGSVGAPGGVLSAQPQGAAGHDPLLGLLRAGSLAPGAGDVLGPLSDLRMFQQQPESRTLANAGLFAIGMAPAVPSLAWLMGRKVDAPTGVPRSQRGMMGSVAPPKLDPERIAQTALPGTEAFRLRVQRGLEAQRRGRELSGQVSGAGLDAGRYDIPASAFSMKPAGEPAIRMLVNPSPDDLRQFARERKGIKTLRTYEEGGKLFAWDARDAIHADMASALRLEYDPRKGGLLPIEDL